MQDPLSTYVMGFFIQDDGWMDGENRRREVGSSIPPRHAVLMPEDAASLPVCTASNGHASQRHSASIENEGPSAVEKLTSPHISAVCKSSPHTIFIDQEEKK